VQAGQGATLLIHEATFEPALKDHVRALISLASDLPVVEWLRWDVPTHNTVRWLSCGLHAWESACWLHAAHDSFHSHARVTSITWL
jgi:hypothetical protein